MIGRAFQIKRIQRAKLQNQEKLGSIQETEKGSVWLKPGRESGQDEVGKMDRNQITHGHVDHGKKFRFYSKSKESKSLNVFSQRVT